MYFDRFDICEAYYCYMALYHGGQWSKEYALTGVFDRIQFSPRDSITTNPDNLEENGHEIFDNLVETNGANIRDRRV